MKKLRVATRSFADFEIALAAQLDAYREKNPEIEVEAIRFDLRGLENAVLGSNGFAGAGWDLARRSVRFALLESYRLTCHSRTCLSASSRFRNCEYSTFCTLLLCPIASADAVAAVCPRIINTGSIRIDP